MLEYGNGWYNVKSGRLLKVSYSTSFDQKADISADTRINGMDLKMAGTKMIQTATCLSCHSAQDKVLGPTFADIAEKYKADSKALKSLSLKVKNGGTGVWGNQPMPAHTMYKDTEIVEMVKAVLKTKKLGGHKK